MSCGPGPLDDVILKNYVETCYKELALIPEAIDISNLKPEKWIVGEDAFQ